VKDDPQQSERISRVTTLLSDQLTALDGSRHSLGAGVSMQQFLTSEKKAGDAIRLQLGAMQDREQLTAG
jgi:hypothetical protein